MSGRPRRKAATAIKNFAAFNSGGWSAEGSARSCSGGSDSDSGVSSLQEIAMEGDLADLNKSIQQSREAADEAAKEVEKCLSITTEDLDAELQRIEQENAELRR